MADGNRADGNRVADAVIVGAGVMGASCALHLASAGLRKLLVVEKGPGVGSGSTGRSTAIIRQTYSNFEVSLMAHEALQRFQALARLPQAHGVPLQALSFGLQSPCRSARQRQPLGVSLTLQAVGKAAQFRTAAGDPRMNAEDEMRHRQFDERKG